MISLPGAPLKGRPYYRGRRPHNYWAARRGQSHYSYLPPIVSRPTNRS